MDDFFRELFKIYDDLKNKMSINIPMLITPEQEQQYQNTNICHICNKEIYFKKVRDHDHSTGLYRGPAHSKCNINYTVTKKIPVTFHNLKNCIPT